MIFAGPATAPTGIPPPIIFPSMIRSGAMPMLSAIEPKQSRNPDITSSQIRSAPLLCAISASAFNEPGVRIHHAHVGGDRLDDHGGDFLRRGAE